MIWKLLIYKLVMIAAYFCKCLRRIGGDEILIMNIEFYLQINLKIRRWHAEDEEYTFISVLDKSYVLKEFRTLITIFAI